MNTLTITKNQSYVRVFKTFTKSSLTVTGFNNKIRPTTWPTKEVLDIKLVNLDEATKDADLAFFEANQGLNINLIRIDNQGVSGDPCPENNENSTTWIGMVQSSISIIKKNRSCPVWDLSFSFMGDKQ